MQKRIEQLPSYDGKLQSLWEIERASFEQKIIVLDDDPTGVQTVHGVPVYTDWSLETIQAMFQEPRQLVFLLTNSRAFSVEETTKVHKQIGERIAAVSKKMNQDFVLISRSDSTLRGHFPLETEVLKETLEREYEVNGEILIPFFKEGGRETIDDVHYVKQEGRYIPAGETEFAKDRMFGFTKSNLKDYIAEKTNNEYPANSVLSISLEELRALDFASIEEKLMRLEQFGKMVVNAVSEEDLKVFTIALIRVLQRGRHFLFRTAASFTKVIGDISSRPYLTAEELMKQESATGGLILIGSHVQKTTDQLKELQALDSIDFIEFNCQLVVDNGQFDEEIERVQQRINKKVAEGITVCVYTSRSRIDLGAGRQEEELALSVKISAAVTQFVQHCDPQPAFVLAKGGITSSDVGTKGLAVKKAEVAGQIAPGIPVWKTGEESRFPGIPYIIFPGNVGESDTLRNVAEILLNRD
ncbi:four-carbon acid sugar kinase family protein [Sporosarcina cascadiensis]|uniref:four-carbon acid sugar kinase family protein n=1 Tax=Sporosarcina cascadiensis TaxID=2660747 RepID=UPI00129B0406|nr:four-carbon acid sugar kinase family protein [Sporosarcina cascadiensis]